MDRFWSQEQISRLANAGIALNGGPTGGSPAVVERARWNRFSRSHPEIGSGDSDLQEIA